MAAGLLRIVVLSFAVMAGTAHAQDHWGAWNPPERYDHPYHGRLIEHALPRSQVLEACKKLFARYGFADKATRGCAVETVIGKECTVIYANRTYMGTTPEETRRHEIGHCNGWGPDHPS